MANLINTIQHGDCIQGMNSLPAGCVDLAFADPPFNIGYEYDVYDDRKEHQHYMDWSRDWITAVYRVLKDDGTFWLAIGDEYAAELKLLSQDVGFHCRSWVIWYYTFGVNCANKFTRSHAHLFYFVKNRDAFTFDADANRVPSARQLVYNDKRANPKGRLPDDTWIIRPADAAGDLNPDEEEWIPPTDSSRTFQLRPQDIEGCFQPSEDTWYIPRVAGTFKERAGFHGCQMPEQLLGRVIRCCSREDELVLDPFSGSATTLAVAKKLGRTFLGFDLSQEYVEHGRRRVSNVNAGDLLDGSPEPLISAPATSKPRTKKLQRKSAQRVLFSESDPATSEASPRLSIASFDAEIIEAFRTSHDGYSADRIIADPELNAAFLEKVSQLGVEGKPRDWNTRLFALRKRGALASIPTTKSTRLSWVDCDAFLHASEIALRHLLDKGAESLDAVLCDPELAAMFDETAVEFAPSSTSADVFRFRWAALKIRKQARNARDQSESVPWTRFGQKPFSIDDLNDNLPGKTSGVYLITSYRGKTGEHLYAGSTIDLRTRLLSKFGKSHSLERWRRFGTDIRVQLRPLEIDASELVTFQSVLGKKFMPKLNLPQLWTA